MPVNYVTTNADEYIFVNEYTLSDAAGWTYDRDFRFTLEDFDKLIDRINRVHPTTNWGETGTAVTYATAEPQEEEAFDTTEIEKYIDSLEKEVVGTEN